MVKTSSELGHLVHEHLMSLGIETPMTSRPQQQKNTAGHFSKIMDNLGLDLSDDSLKETPGRVAKMYCEEIFYGLNYNKFPVCTTIENKMNADEMIATSCSLRSMCEHHFVPFIGVIHCAYIPDTKILGLSKFNRVSDFFCRRPQVQERLTLQIAAALSYILGTPNVAVVTRATHYCTHLRGVQDQKSETITSKMGGKFLTVSALRQEFLALTR